MIVWTEYAKVFLALLTILNPIGNCAVFLTLTANYTPRERRRTARVTALATGIVLFVSAFIGEWILSLFGIHIATFKVGGGILVLLIAISMLHAHLSHSKHTPEEAKEAAKSARDSDEDGIAVVPLAVPLLAGPGAIGSVIIFSHISPSWTHTWVLCVVTRPTASRARTRKRSWVGSCSRP